MAKAVARAKSKDLEVIDAGELLGADEDEQLAITVGNAIKAFIRDLAGFFTTAKALEEAAISTLTIARTLTAPTNPDEDEAIQRFVKKTSADKREVEEHWRITSLVSQFHRRMTSRRAKATDLLDQANQIGNALHNRYVTDEKRKAAEAQERLRREAEDQARRDREAELARLEQEAVDREAASPDLSPRELRFVDLVVTPGYTITQAAAGAGYKDSGRGFRLIEQSKIAKAIKAKQEAIALRSQHAAKKAAPLEVEVPTVKPNVTRAGNAYDRTTHGAEILDEAALIEACISGKYGIPRDILTVKPAKVNEYGRSMKELIDRWPGVRHTKKTGVV